MGRAARAPSPQVSMTADRARLARLASLLEGERWQVPLARRLERNERLVRRWASGKYPVPAWVWTALERALRERLAEIMDALSER